ncbi:hypothetical protein EIP91_010521 [Steccherinum ochraceum]|uniref:Uncharacterized protein n=1 Tax=Steccherinum ochraceum TaxID=92696 RepID=A0A4R0R338_9APHY|nr:hypothetical protein EIP91_010521 [Steccherinum ochraceum]
MKRFWTLAYVCSACPPTIVCSDRATGEEVNYTRSLDSSDEMSTEYAMRKDED